jgi:kynurenine formamidase
MRKSLVVGAAVLSAAGFIAAATGDDRKNVDPPAAERREAKPVEELAQRLATAQALDLTWPADEKMPVWPGSSTLVVEPAAAYEKEGFFANNLTLPEHLGTHLDAPVHFAPGMRPVDQIPVEALHGELVVIDIADKVAKNADALLEAADLELFEGKNGRIGKGMIVFVRTGWADRFGDPGAYANQDKDGRLHFPGIAGATAKHLADRGVKGVGIDTLSIDRGIAGDFPAHHAIAKADVWAIENLNAELGKLPARGAYVMALPMRVRGGSGGPVRVVAFVPR